MIKFDLVGTTYEYDDTSMTVSEARILKKHAGYGLRSWALALQDMDPDALVGLVFLAKRRAGEAVRWQDLDNLDIAKIGILDSDEDAEKGDDASPPETTPSSTSGRTRKR
jgi:hypothetical protein